MHHLCTCTNQQHVSDCMLTQAPAAAPILVCQAAFSPFTQVALDGSSAILADGSHRYALTSRAGSNATLPPLLNPGGAKPLAWRTLIGDTTLQKVQEPMIEFVLTDSGRQALLPPPTSSEAVSAATTKQLADHVGHMDQHDDDRPMQADQQQQEVQLPQWAQPQKAPQGDHNKVHNLELHVTLSTNA